MRIVAKTIQAALELAFIVGVTPAVLAYVAIVRLLDWVELHGEFGGDKDALDRARWRHS